MENMKFVLESVSPRGVRMGRIMVKRDGREFLLSTPSCLSHTSMGHFPYLTPDLLDKVAHRPNGVLLSSSTLYEKPGPTVVSTAANKGIHQFLHLQDSIVYLSVQNPGNPPPSSYNDEKSVSVWRPSGRKKITVSDHMSLVSAFKPDVFEALCDTASSHNNKGKRIKKSVDRTLRFLDKSLEIMQDNGSNEGVLGVIEGSDNIEERLRSARETALRPVHGFMFEGFQLPYDTEGLGRVLGLVMELLPADKPRFIVGLHLPKDIFVALENGIDVFDSSPAATATDKGHVLSYEIGTEIHQLQKHNEEQRHDTAVIDGVVDLNDIKFASDFRPLVSGCGCHTCTTYTRAYVHHLLVTKEILAGILLTIHNFSHLFSFYYNLQYALGHSLYEEFVTLCVGKTKTQTDKTIKY